MNSERIRTEDRITSIARESQGARLAVLAGPYTFGAVLEEDRAPETCAAFRRMLPFRSRIIHSRWSGEAAWIPLGDLGLGVGYENHTSHPAPGHVLLYPGGMSETEILFPYGGSRFASIVGQLAGNHFLTIVEGTEHLRPLGELVLWEGAQDISFDLHNAQAARDEGGGTGAALPSGR